MTSRREVRGLMEPAVAPGRSGRRWRPRLTRRWPSMPSSCWTRRPAGASRPSTRSRPSRAVRPPARHAGAPAQGPGRPRLPVEQKRALLTDLGGGRLERATVELLATAATRQRVRLRDFPSLLAALAAMAAFTAADQAGQLDQLEGELFFMAPWSSSSRRSARP